ncbi:MAG: aromatic ring-hydroxylating dioxygenase subunit alpha [Betaproteobacteria bacterium]|nr:aromatic ring-hydroxylating dioxygenase subunit alpha [Betaproteobacteria bacterium]MDH5222986.1 aromatic ring-hydroxylating dioxygenase subunit alpha [Betaproteobacteria bacterium]MDH5352657.1 aromatic ring-hydroxylating dioxygenase subunit alpha [Betaproteobacteria bacterium]
MISAEQNELMTRIGAGTPAGRLLRRYWQPVAIADELDAARPVKAVRLFGEELVLYRAAGGYGLMQRHCPHRGADLAYGRLEPDGLRCSFHGWKFDAAGNCVETPAEPEGSRMCEQIRTVSYPVVEKSGVLFAYLGAGAPPAFPHFDCFVAPATHTFAFKGYWDCNWLQALEVGIDPAHASWLHKYFEDEDPAASYGRQFRGTPADSSLPISKVLREYDRPEIRVERTEYGMRLQTLRKLSDAQTHIRVTNVLFPQAFVIPMNAEMTITQFHVPVDDTGCYWYSIFTSFGAPVDKDTMRAQRLKTYPAPDYKPIFGRANGWGFNAEEQRTRTFTGMGFDINIHDQFACESQGPIQDRTRENLGSSDKGIVLYRRILVDAIRRNEAGETPLMVVDDAQARTLTGPPAIDGIGPSARVEEYWKETDAVRRRQAAWAA